MSSTLAYNNLSSLADMLKYMRRALNKGLLVTIALLPRLNPLFKTCILEFPDPSSGAI